MLLLFLPVPSYPSFSVHFPYPFWDFIRLELMHGLYTVSMSLCVHQLCSILSLWHPSPLALTIFLPSLLYIFLKHKGGIWWIHSICNRMHQIFNTLRIVHFRISMLIVIYCKKLFWWWLSEVLTYGYNGMPMEAILLLCFFQITQGLFLRIWGELDPQFDQSNVCNVGTFKISSYIKLCLRTSHMSIANLQYTCLSNCSCVPRPKFMMSYYCMYISIYMNNSIYNLTETI